MKAALALALALALAPAAASAQEAAQASFHDTRAREHYRTGRYAEAARELFAVQRIAPSPGNLFNLGLCFDQLGRPALATYYFSAYLQAEAPDTSPERRRIAQRTIRRLGSRIARLRVDSAPPGADVFVDEPEHGSYGRTPVTIPVEPGPHRLWLRREGHRQAELSVRVGRAESATVSRTLEQLLGWLDVTVTPTTAEVLVLDADERSAARARGPTRFSLPPGVYVVQASAPGFALTRALARVTEDEHARVDLRPTALPPPTGQLVVTANQLGALVELDGEPQGFTPTVLPAVPAGPHRLRLSAPGLQSLTRDLEVKASARGFLTASLTPPPTDLPPISAWIAGGVGAASLVAAAVVGGFAVAHHDDFAQRYAAGPEDLRDARATGRRLNAVTDGLLVGGLLGLGLGAVLYALDDGEGGSRANLSWQTEEAP